MEILVWLIVALVVVAALGVMVYVLHVLLAHYEEGTPEYAATMCALDPDGCVYYWRDVRNVRAEEEP